MRIIIYSSILCPYCHSAKALLNKLNLDYKEILIDNDPMVKKQMINLSNRNTVPQIFFGDKHIGGYDDLQKLNKEGVIFNLINDKK
ncbi:MAG: glutaredoxin 3 [Pseudomonadota bacterium]|nr:glutaredoxin 3 [Pseudomonadota bacterium]